MEDAAKTKAQLIQELAALRQRNAELEDALQKQTEQKLVIYQQIFSSTPDAVAFLDKTYRYRLANDAYEVFSNIKRENFIGLTVAEYLGEDVFNELVKDHFDQCLQGDIIRYQAWFDYPTLGRRYVDVTYYPVRDSDDQVIGIIANTRDITDLKRAEEQTHFQAHLLDTVEQAVIATDPAGHVVYWNPFAERLYGWSAAEATGKTTLELLATEESMTHGQEIMAALNRGESWAGEYLARDRAGRHFPIHTSINSVCDDRGVLQTLIAISYDITERKQTEESLRKNEERYRAIVKNSADGIVLYNQAGAVTEWNLALEQITGIPQAEAVGCWAWDIYVSLAQPPYLMDIEQHKAVMMAFLTEQESADGVLYEYDIKDVSTGQRRSLETRMFSFQLDDELVIGSIVRDVTERKQAEEALKKSEAQYRLLAANLPEMDVYLFDTEMRFLVAAGTLMKQVGLTPQDIEGKRLTELLDEERRDFFVPSYQRALAGEHFKAEYAYAGQHYYHQVMPLIDEQSEIYGGIALTQNITERKRVEEALRESEVRLRTIANNVPGLVAHYKLNPDGRDEALFVSEGVEKIYEVTQEDALQDMTLLWERIHPDDVEACSASIQASAEKLTLWEQEYRLEMPDGRVKWLYARGVPHKVADGSVIWNTLIVEITERKQLEADLIRARDAAEAANKAKSVFLANMSHELRTPLNGILGYAQVLQLYTTLDAEQQKYVNTIEQSGQYLLTLIDDILDIARVESGKISLRPAKLEIIDFLTGLSRMIRVRAEQKGLTFVADFAPDLPLFVQTDEKRLRQILINLLSNAVKFTDTGRVTFKVNRLEQREAGPTERLRFTIEDTGRGIPPEELENIFQPFHQVLDQDDLQEGVGLGLAISRHLASLMGSSIQVESWPGQGCIFWLDIDLPVVTGVANVGATPAQKIVGFRGDAPTILVVDDVATNREVLRNFLTAIGIEVAVAEDGLKGLDVAEAVQPDLILADLRMPHLDGYEMVRRLRKIESLQSVPIIGISASAYTENVQKSLAAGCDAFLSKPVDLDALSKLLAQLLSLEWIYDNIEPQHRPDAALTTPLVVPPPDLLHELQVMVNQGDILGIKAQLPKIKAAGDQYAPFVNRIDRLASELQIKAIERLLREVL